MSEIEDCRQERKEESEMGVGGGGFWELLKPLARFEDVDFLRNKRVAVDLSYWIVQQEMALKGNVRNPHLRVTFFRTINLFSKFGAFPVFVVDGDPSPMKNQARAERFFRMSGMDLSELPKSNDISVPRNKKFTACIQECVELLGLMGMPVVKAKSEAEALCAQLNRDGHVDACITADSDAFLFGAICVIKSIAPNNKGLIECYHLSDIEAKLGLQRKQMISIALLVGNDYDLNGIQGIGLATAVRIVKLYNEDEVLNKLSEVAKDAKSMLLKGCEAVGDCFDSDKDVPVSPSRPPHCSCCGHPGNKGSHLKIACSYCEVDGSNGCVQKPEGFKCGCPNCSEMLKIKEQRKDACWRLKAFKMIQANKNFPDPKIIEMFLCDQHNDSSGNEAPSLEWEKPNEEQLIVFLTFHQFWRPATVRKMMLPMLSTMFLREVASKPDQLNMLLCDQYAFDSIRRVKIRLGRQSYTVNWKRVRPQLAATQAQGPASRSEGASPAQGESETVVGSNMLDDDLDAPQFVYEDGSCMLCTDENMELVRAAFPEVVRLFTEEQEAKKSKSRRRKSSEKENVRSPRITDFYRSVKTSSLLESAKKADSRASSQFEVSPLSKRLEVSPAEKSSKSVRRKLIFD